MFWTATMLVRISLFVIASVAVAQCSDILKHGYVDHIICKANEEYCPNPICKLTFVTRKVKAFTWICNLTKPIDLVHFHVTLYYRYRNGYQKFLVDLNIDVCAYYNNTLGSAVIDLVRDELEKYSNNIMHPCPYTGNISIVAMPLTGALLKYMFIPSGEYKLVITCEFDAKKLFGLSLTIFFFDSSG